jgi:LGFP repeat
MSKLMINYKFDDTSVANPDGSFNVAFTGATTTSGPGNTTLGQLKKALSLGSAGKAAVQLTNFKPDFRKFCIRLSFQAAGPISGRQNLAESDFLPFALFLEKGTSSSNYILRASVGTNAHGWNGPSTRFKKVLRTGRWYTATLAYDTDTAALFVDDDIVSVYAFPAGRLKKGAKKGLFLGTWVDGRRNHFKGKLAAFQWYNDIPEEIESRLDERRSHAEWFVTYKYEAIRRKVALGQPTAALVFDGTTGTHLQQYQHGAIMFHDSVGAAFEIHGAIHAKYKSMSNRSKLGYLVSDETATTRGGGRKSVFSSGAVYWSSRTGAIPVLGQIYLDYEHIGESRAIGFPIKPERSIRGGIEQEFQSARMYLGPGFSNAHEVHGAILTKYLSSGGVNKWGFPVTDEKDIIKSKRVVGKFSEFEGCTIYWSSGTGAHEVHGSIRRKYQELKGPIGDLGFPTSDELDIPNYGGTGRISTFKSGSLLWYGSYDSIIVARPFKVFIGRINSRESEGAFMGQNDLYSYITLKDGSRKVYSRRHPRTGDWGGRNIKNVNFTIPKTVTPNVANKTIVFTVDVRDADPGKDDRLGKWTKKLTAGNAWGLREKNGVLKSKSFSKIRSITASIKPLVNPKSLSESEKFWGVRNQGTNKISWQQHASAFRDVDSETEWWDVTDWLDKAFYELVTEDLAKNGNCFGMSLEAIYARKNCSLFGLPLNRFTSWNTVRNEFNIKHLYQVGAGPIWWFLGEFITGNTHDPKDVFIRTRREFEKGNHPVLCISQNYDFSGAPHCILPVAWDSSRKPWRITICDPNFPNATKVLTVNPDANTFEYKGSKTYRGGEWSGGRLHYMPFSRLNRSPRTPLWDAILLLLSGTIIILADDAQTTSITDAKGNDLDGFGSRATNLVKSGQPLDEFFVGYKGFDQPTAVRVSPTRVSRARITPGRLVLPKIRGKGTVTGEILLRKEQWLAQGEDPGTSKFAHMPIGTLLSDRRLRTVATALRSQPSMMRAVAGRTVHHALSDPSVVAKLSSEVRGFLGQVAKANSPSNFIHRISGKRNGHLGYAMKHRLSEVRIGSTLRSGEKHKVEVNDLGTSKNTVRMDATRNKQVTLKVANKLGVKGDKIRVTIDRIPVSNSRNLDVNVKPGLGGLELMGAAQQAKVPVNVEAVISGRTTRRKFTLPIEQGVRLKLSSLITENELGFSRIDRLFGPVRATGRVRGD